MPWELTHLSLLNVLFSPWLLSSYCKLLFKRCHSYTSFLMISGSWQYFPFIYFVCVFIIKMDSSTNFTESYFLFQLENVCNLFFIICLFYLVICLKRGRERSFIIFFTPQTPTTVSTLPGLSQELGSQPRSSSWVARIHWPFSASPGMQYQKAGTENRAKMCIWVLHHGRHRSQAEPLPSICFLIRMYISFVFKVSDIQDQINLLTVSFLFAPSIFIYISFFFIF